MIELPRITRALRAHTQLDKPRNLKPKPGDYDVLLTTRKSLEKYKTFSNICKYIEENEDNCNILLELLANLKDACKLLVPDHADDVTEEAAVMTLRMLLDQQVVMVKDLSRLRQTFGEVTSATANKICTIVKQIAEELSDNAKNYIMEETLGTQEESQLWGGNIQYYYIPYKPIKRPLPKLTKKPATASQFVVDFSMKYKEPKESHPPAKPAQPAEIKPYTKRWLEKKMRQLFPGDDCTDYFESVLNFLHSSQSNEEMQNELFELLGFDKIDFIQELLVHRQEIVTSLLSQVQEPTVPVSEILADKSKMPQYLCQVSVLSEEEKLLMKLAQKEEKKARSKKHKHDEEDDTEPEINIAQMRARRLAELSKPVVPFSASKSSDPVLQRISYAQTKVMYPNVYDSSLDAKNSPGFVSGLKLYLPANAIKNNFKEYEEVIIPKNEPAPLTVGNKRVPISDLDEIGQMVFENVTELNRIQSVVFQTAYNTNENLLICAPTGAGKTNIALLTVVHQIKQHIENNVIMKNKFKIIYIAPMKALASEMTASFGKRLAGLGITVRELTGDMKLTKWEVHQTQMIVTTPEKWDVVTRKGATDTELASIVKLLIIDEVHLLHGDRGPIVEAVVARTLRQVESTQNMIRIVGLSATLPNYIDVASTSSHSYVYLLHDDRGPIVESVVARTLRQVESTQNMIRIVGLSATLPNYIDVARFLRVNPMIGLFFFDSRFRPVPLEQQFIGIKETGGGGGTHLKQMQQMNEICYEKAVSMVMKGHQVMVFVHARNATHQTALVLKELAQKKGHLKHFEPESSAAFTKAMKSISSSPNKQLAELFASGFACHHAGMLRSDRNMVEKYFSDGFIRVLVCTSTLAWGVNLPAHAVIIRGTEIYDQTKGNFVDLSILDVLQIFGRAGRPQFDTSGTGIIITTHNKLSHYLKSMTNQFPIESNFINLLADNLNAEVALGTVTNIDEAVEWLSYTYLFVRMRINPHVYGLNFSDVQEEPLLETKRRELITAAALELDKTQMIRYDERTGDLSVTGRVTNRPDKFALVCTPVYGLNFSDVQEEPLLETKRRELITAAALELDKTQMIRYDERTGDLSVTGRVTKSLDKFALVCTPVYGLNFSDVQEEPLLETKRRELITAAALELDKTQMIRYDERTGDLSVTGRVTKSLDKFALVCTPVYGLNFSDVQEEPLLETKRRELITAAALELDKTQMIRYDERTGDLSVTDLGRTASHYYITCETMQVYSWCSDFKQLKVRKEELSDLRTLHEQYCEIRVDGGLAEDIYWKINILLQVYLSRGRTSSSSLQSDLNYISQYCEIRVDGGQAEDIYWKINILLQVYLSRGRTSSSSLQSDLNYISQNAVRIVRALFEITLRKNNAYMAALYLKMAKMMELQMWDFYSDMRQFNCFPEEVLRHIENPMLRADQIRDMDWKELGDLIRNPKAARHLKQRAEEFPLVDMDATIHPITRTVLRIRLTIVPNFKWNDKYHSKAPEAFWVWVEDPEYDIMYYHEYFLLTKKQVQTKEPQELIITIPIMEPLPPQYYIRVTSERWLGSESVLPLSFQDLILPETHPPHTDILYLQPLPVKALKNPAYEALYPFSHFNPIQTQIFHTLYHSDNNVLLGAPTGSGKTIIAEIAMFRAFNNYPGCKVVYIAPLKALVKERMKDWSVRLEGHLGMKVVELTGDVSPDIHAIRSSSVIVTTPEKWDGISRSWQTRAYVKDVVLIVIDEIHLLGEDRGPVLEVIVSRAYVKDVVLKVINEIHLLGEGRGPVLEVIVSRYVKQLIVKCDAISRSWQTRAFVKDVVLIVIDEIHLLGEDRRPVLEVIVSRAYVKDVALIVIAEIHLLGEDRRAVLEVIVSRGPVLEVIVSRYVKQLMIVKSDAVNRSWQTREFKKDVVLIVIDEIHLLGEDRGPVLEVIVSRYVKQLIVKCGAFSRSWQTRAYVKDVVLIVIDEIHLLGEDRRPVLEVIVSRYVIQLLVKSDAFNRSWQTRAYVKDVVLIVIDEIHLLGEDRGPVLEVIVSRANFIESHTSRKLRIIGLSTAMANARDLADWLNIGKTGLYNFKPYVRPVPLQIHVAGFPGRHYCPRMMTMNKPTFQAIRQHSPKSPALVFVSSRRQTRLTALDLIAYLAAEENPKQWLHMEESQMEQVLANIKESNLKLTLAFGIGIHHAGLHEKDRNTVEELFVNQKIQVLICTATLAWGVNFPAHLVVIKGTEYYDGKQKRYVDMPITDVLQMMGRAGRPQYDNHGVAVVLCHDQKKNFYKKFFYEPFPIESSLLNVLPDHLNAEIVAGTVTTKQDIIDYMTWTYFFRRLLKNPSYYNLESLEPEDINYYLSYLVQGSLDVLAQAGCIEIEEDERTVHCTWMGRIASYYYLSYKTMAHFSANLVSNMPIDLLLRLLADCEEYATLPVRHNEDVLNGELSQQCRLPVDALTLDSSNVKAFLLLQAHMSRLVLPNTDYLTDTKSVLDQTIRIIQAMIDTSAENGWLAVSLSCQMMMQSIVQARWPTDSPLTTLPHVESQHLYMFTQMAKDTNKPCTTLNGLKVACMKNYELLAKYLRREFDEKQIEQIHTVICDLPTLDIKLSIRGLWYDADHEQDKLIRQPPQRDEWIPVHADQEYVLILEMRRRGANKNTVYCPRFPRSKNEGWFITLGIVEHGELSALKRVNRGTTQITFYTPSETGRIIYTVYIMSDSYMGLDQQYDLQLEVIDPLPTEKVEQVYDTVHKTLLE
ncbi:sec63 brl domain-containing protein [Phthorimaea operculella]|nr:sec63 brl domain-containing protein [Phthorimaea operculella]